MYFSKSTFFEKYIFYFFIFVINYIQGNIIFNAIFHLLILNRGIFTQICIFTKISLITKCPFLYWVKIFSDKKIMKQINKSTCNSTMHHFKICKSAIQSLGMCITLTIFDNLILYIKCHIPLLTCPWGPFPPCFSSCLNTSTL